MPQTQEHNENEQQRMSSVEQKLGLLDYRLTKSEVVLEKIEESLSKITILIEKHQVLREDLTTLEKRFEDRKTKTDPVIEDSQKIIGRVQGAGMIIGVLMGVIGWVAISNIDRLDMHDALLSEHKSEIAVIKSDFKAHQESDNMIRGQVKK